MSELYSGYYNVLNDFSPRQHVEAYELACEQEGVNSVTRSVCPMQTEKPRVRIHAELRPVEQIGAKTLEPQVVDQFFLGEMQVSPQLQEVLLPRS